ncbi:MAG: deoxyribodipyrimidine photo-lyase [Alphaproteobacteria bacterium]
MSDAAPAIVWFRQDLRVADNPALAAAVQSGRPTLALYILDEETPGIRAFGGAARWWLHQSLESLADGLAARGVRLVLRKGKASTVLDEVIGTSGADAVFWNRCYTQGAVDRDTEIKDRLKAFGLAVESFNGSLLLEPWRIETGQGEPYKVFTPFWRRLRELYRALDAPVIPETLSSGPDIPGDHLSDWHLMPISPDWAGGIREDWSVGEEAARGRLSQFLGDGVEDYPVDRDRPDRCGTSRLSPHLFWGEISPHQVWRAAAKLVDEGGRRGSGAESLLRELAWRDFNHHLLFHFPEIATQNWKGQFDSFPWRDNPDGLAAWQKGRTGYPIVDAGMRELWHTGWMHNRVRMIVASFLIKDLLVDWRAGEAWFWDTLVDADPANNAGNWQWVAGSGADAAPFFRIFNPVSQGEKFDPDGDYVRRWIPEIADLPKKYIQKPWEAPGVVLSDAGVALGNTYPAPIVNHGVARTRALEAYKAIRSEG